MRASTSPSFGEHPLRASELRRRGLPRSSAGSDPGPAHRLGDRFPLRLREPLGMPVFPDRPHRVSGERVARLIQQRPDAVEAFPVLVLRRDQPVRDRGPPSRERIQLGVKGGSGRDPPQASGVGDLRYHPAVQGVRLRRPDPAFPDLRRLQRRYKADLQPQRFRPPYDGLGVYAGRLQDDLRPPSRFLETKPWQWLHPFETSNASTGASPSIIS